MMFSRIWPRSEIEWETFEQSFLLHFSRPSFLTLSLIEPKSRDAQRFILGFQMRVFCAFSLGCEKHSDSFGQRLCPVLQLKHDKAVIRRKGQVRPVKAGGGTYGGEATGIRTNLSRSVRIQNWEPHAPNLSFSLYILEWADPTLSFSYVYWNEQIQICHSHIYIYIYWNGQIIGGRLVIFLWLHLECVFMPLVSLLKRMCASHMHWKWSSESLFMVFLVTVPMSSGPFQSEWWGRPVDQNVWRSFELFLKIWPSSTWESKRGAGSPICVGK